MKKEISKILDELAMLLISQDADNSSYKNNYDEEDVMNATHIFSCILSNYSIKKGFTKSAEDGKRFGTDIRGIVLNMTDIDTKKFYK